MTNERKTALTWDNGIAKTQFVNFRIKEEEGTFRLGGADVLASSDVDDIILRMFDSLQKDKAKLLAERHAVIANRDKLVKLLFCLRDRETIIADLKNSRELFAETASAVAMYDEVPKKLLELMGWTEHGVGDEGKN